MWCSFNFNLSSSLRFAGSLSIQLVKLASIRDSGLGNIFTSNLTPMAFIKVDLDQDWSIWKSPIDQHNFGDRADENGNCDRCSPRHWACHGAAFCWPGLSGGDGWSRWRRAWCGVGVAWWRHGFRLWCIWPCGCWRDGCSSAGSFRADWLPCQ